MHSTVDFRSQNEVNLLNYNLLDLYYYYYWLEMPSKIDVLINTITHICI